ncbi:hypothetical protein CYMTET_12511 [Cymbomonas tetramitiformis]|uniref:Tyrosine-protein phosphatase domain-containing protein n=1 Tax=Cymbomonas tetramitiformis TaxID=36881 RepID=A0AAE0GKB5_9CHLO|nr:hypothetical protein CYMTET_12511 [Cymbomonas tetramitiformis]
MVHIEEIDDDEPPPLEVNAEESDAEEARFIIGLVASGLYLGNMFALNRAVLDEHGISHVIAVGKDLPCALSEDARISHETFRWTPTAASEQVQYEYEEDGIGYMVLEVEDSADVALLNFMHGCFEFIKSALKDEGANRKSRVLVACEEGTSLSVTVLASYLICEGHVAHEAAMESILRVQPSAEPNRGFARHLRYLERNKSLPNWVLPSGCINK